MDEFKELYENLSPNKLSIENVTQLESKVEILEQEIKQLEAALNRSELDKRNLNINYERDKKALLDNHERILANISALFKTAKKEIERKNNTIKELRQQLDDLVFRRQQRRWAPQNEVVQSQTVDDAASAKAAKEDRIVASVIRPTGRNQFSDREKSSSGDKSPVPAQFGARQHEYAEKDKRVDSSRVKCVQKYPQSTSLEGSPDEFLDSKHSADSYPYRRSERQIREADDFDCRVHRKVKERHRYSPYTHCKEDYEKCRPKHLRREHSHDDEEYSKSRAKRSPYDRGRHEFGDGYRAVDSRQRVECASQRLREDRKSDHSSHGANDRRREAKSSLGDRRMEDPAYQKLIDDRRRQCPGKLEDGRKSNEYRRREDALPESNVRWSFENRRKETEAPQKLVEDPRRENPANHEFGGRNLNEIRWREDLAHAKSGGRNSTENQRKENVTYEKPIEDPKRKSPGTLEFGGRNTNDARRKGDSVSIESSARTSLVDRSKGDVVRPKSIYDRRQESLANLELNSRRLNADGRKENPSYPEFVAREPVYSRQKDLTQGDLSARKSIEVPSREHQATNLVVNDRKSVESCLKDNLASAESAPKELVEDLSKVNMPLRKSIHDREQASSANLKFNGQKSNEDQRKHSPANQRSVVRKPIDNRQGEDLTRGDLDARKLIKIQDREHQAANFVVGGRKSNESRRKDDPAHFEFDTKKSIGDQSKEKLDHQKSIKDPSQPSGANLEFVGRKSIGSRIKKEVDHRKSVKDQRQDCLANQELASQKSNEDRQEENAVALPEFSGKKSIAKQKEDPAHPEIVATQSTNDKKDMVCANIAARKLIHDRKRDATVTKLGGKKSVVDRAKENLSNPKRGAKKPNENRRSEDAANSSQGVVENQVPSTSHAQGDYPVDGQMKAVDILAQYGVYATPYKLLNGDKRTFANFKQISPIADTPDHLKALFNDSKAKVNPIPMINEHRALEGFNSPAKKPTPEVTKEDSVAVNRESIEEPPKTVADESLVGPSPSKLSKLNTVTTSPFKNCCIVKVTRMDAASEVPAKELPKVCDTYSMNTEQGVFSRKRRAPVIRHVKKAES